MTATLFPDAVKKVGALAATFSATQEPRNKIVEAGPTYGWGFSETNLEYNPVGEADWTPFVKQVQAAGSTSVYFVGTCLPGFQLFDQAAKANGLDVPMFSGPNFYEANCAAANTDGTMDNLYISTAFIPFACTPSETRAATTHRHVRSCSTCTGPSTSGLRQKSGARSSAIRAGSPRS